MEQMKQVTEDGVLQLSDVETTRIWNYAAAIVAARVKAKDSEDLRRRALRETITMATLDYLEVMASLEERPRYLSDGQVFVSNGVLCLKLDEPGPQH